MKGSWPTWPRITLADMPAAKDVIRGIRDRVPGYIARCPDCGYPLYVEEHVLTFRPQTGEYFTSAAVAICNDCGFTHTFDPDRGRTPDGNT